VIERSKRSSWPAGYVIVPVALLAGALQILIPSAAIGWLDDALQQASASQASAPAASAPEASASQASAPRPSASQNAEAQLAALQAAAVQAAAAVDAIAEKQHPAPPPQPEPANEIGPGPAPALTKEIAPGPSDEIGSTDPAQPAEAPIRVFIHHSDSPADTEPALQLAAYLQAQGFEVAGVRTVGAAIERPSVRYFFDHDRPGSRRLVEAIGSFFAGAPDLAPETASDFSHFSPKPRLGNVEVWLPGDHRSRKTAAAS
jgi:hypothetical protein